MIKALTAVYSYMPKEIREIAKQTFSPVHFDIDFLSHFFQQPEIMDDIHIPVLNAWVEKNMDNLYGIGHFKDRYVTAGSEEGIREYMSYLLQVGVTSIYTLKGEYEGYKEVGKTRGYISPTNASVIDSNYFAERIETREVEFNDIKGIDPGWFFISNPSARDGNIIPNDDIMAICEAGHKVFLDLAYYDSTDPYIYHVSHPNIKVIVMSFSKPYGLFYFRFGALLSREKVPALYGNKWFKVVPAILFAKNIIENVDVKAMAKGLKSTQENIIDKIRSETGLPIQASDAWILGNIPANRIDDIPAEMLAEIEKFKRGDGYRFCLKPYFEELDK